MYFVSYLFGGEAPPVTTIQNTQAPSEFLTTSIPKQKPRLHKNYLDPLVNEPPLSRLPINMADMVKPKF